MNVSEIYAKRQIVLYLCSRYRVKAIMRADR